MTQFLVVSNWPSIPLFRLPKGLLLALITLKCIRNRVGFPSGQLLLSKAWKALLLPNGLLTKRQDLLSFAKKHNTYPIQGEMICQHNTNLVYNTLFFSLGVRVLNMLTQFDNFWLCLICGWQDPAYWVSDIGLLINVVKGWRFWPEYVLLKFMNLAHLFYNF